MVMGHGLLLCGAGCGANNKYVDTNINKHFWGDERSLCFQRIWPVHGAPSAQTWLKLPGHAISPQFCNIFANIKLRSARIVLLLGLYFIHTHCSTAALQHPGAWTRVPGCGHQGICGHEMKLKLIVQTENPFTFTKQQRGLWTLTQCHTEPGARVNIYCDTAPCRAAAGDKCRALLR